MGAIKVTLGRKTLSLSDAHIKSFKTADEFVKSQYDIISSSFSKKDESTLKSKLKEVYEFVVGKPAKESSK